MFKLLKKFLIALESVCGETAFYAVASRFICCDIRLMYNFKLAPLGLFVKGQGEQEAEQQN